MGFTLSHERAASFSSRTVSGVNASVTTDIPGYQFEYLSIIVEGSAAFASQNLLVKVSQDGTNFITIDTLNIGTGTTFAKHYGPADKGTGLAVNPLDYPYIQVVTPAIGVGNTTTTTLAAK